MPVHITWYDKSRNETNRVQGLTMFERTFDDPRFAKIFISDLKRILKFNKKTYNELWDVIAAASNEYVGTEHDLQREDGTYDKKYGIAIEGAFKVEPEPQEPKILEPFILDSVVHNASGNFRMYGRDYKGNYLYVNVVTNRFAVTHSFNSELEIP